MKYDTLAIIDLDGENNQTTARLVRSLNVFCLVFNLENLENKLTENNCKAAIITGKKQGDLSISLNIPTLDLSDKSADIDEIKKFLFIENNFKTDWQMKQFADDIIKHMQNVVGDKKALCALSGGVDSTVCAVLTHMAIGKNLVCIFVDTGLMRLNEGDEVMKAFNAYDMNVIRVNAEERFLSKLDGVTEPEAKRKIIGEEFIRVFEEEAKKIGAVDFLVQGTIYPDIIESGSKNKAAVKSHHNVGGLPDVIDFKGIIEPVQELFKDEVRKLGLELGISESLIFRQPFPGPGLGVRCIGELKKERLDILRKADAIYCEEIAKAGLDKSIWQYFAVLTGVKSVGVTNDTRTYGETIALRAVHSVDAMTAGIAHIPYDILEKASDRIIAEVEEVNRVVYDITKKPPGTIEWE